MDPVAQRAPTIGVPLRRNSSWDLQLSLEDTANALSLLLSCSRLAATTYNEGCWRRSSTRIFRFHGGNVRGRGGRERGILETTSKYYVITQDAEPPIPKEHFMKDGGIYLTEARVRVRVPCRLTRPPLTKYVFACLIWRLLILRAPDPCQYEV